jgi:hypothetical protein
LFQEYSYAVSHSFDARIEVWEIILFGEWRYTGYFFEKLSYGKFICLKNTTTAHFSDNRTELGHFFAGRTELKKKKGVLVQEK